MTNNKDIELAYGNTLIASQSFIDALDELKGTPYFQGDIKRDVNALLTKLQSRFKKQFVNMFSEENAFITLNVLRDYEKFNSLAVNEKALVGHMTDLFLTDKQFWLENFPQQYELLNGDI